MNDIEEAKLQTIVELGFKRSDEKLDALCGKFDDKCKRIEKRLDKHESLIDILTKRINGLSWKVVGWVMAGVSIPILLGLAITKLF